MDHRKTKRIWLLTAVYTVLLTAASFLVTGCSDDDDVRVPAFSELTVEPAQAVYHVGDRVTLKIKMTSPGSSDMKKSQYWFYASWMFATDEDVDFQEADAGGVFTSSPITLTTAGSVNLYFFGRCEYPRLDFRKIEIARTITVEP